MANGEKLSLTQDDIKLNGWAIESRLYAEDPYRNFLPSIGRLTRYRPPEEGASDTAVVRNDTGVYEGGEISMYYDPMIAKLCTWAPDRAQAIEGMRNALDAFEVEGIGHNIPFLAAVYDHERFISGNITTAFIEEEYPDGFAGVQPDADTARRLAAVAAQLKRIEEERNTAISGSLLNRARPVGNRMEHRPGGACLRCDAGRAPCRVCRRRAGPYRGGAGLEPPATASRARKWMASRWW